MVVPRPSVIRSRGMAPTRRMSFVCAQPAGRLCVCFLPALLSVVGREMRHREGPANDMR